MQNREEDAVPTTGEESPQTQARTIEVHTFQVHLPGLPQLLGANLYSDRKVALRELIQNAHDSCVRRREEDVALGGAYDPWARVRRDATTRELSVEDNGSGLTLDEIHFFLATLGRSYTSTLKDELAQRGHQAALELIGQFGLGFLSAFLVSESVELVTRGFREESRAWKFTSTGDGRYAVEPADRAEIGTTVRLTLKEDCRYLLRRDSLALAIRAVADFMPVPIRLDDEADPINTIDAPWHRDGSVEEYRRYLEARVPREPPLSILPLRSHRGPDGRTIPLSGVLWIPASSQASVGEHGYVQLYLRRMFVCAVERELLPPWARFVTGIVDCPALSTTASRESVCHDGMFAQVRAALEEQILDHVDEIARRDPELCGVPRDVERSAGDAPSSALEAARSLVGATRHSTFGSGPSG